MLAVIGLQAETKTYSYDFSKNTNFVTTKGGTTVVGTSSSNKLNDFYYKDSGDKFNAGGTGYFNSGYFIFGKSGAYVELPTYANEKITNITATTSSGGSTSVYVAIYSGETVAVSAVKWSAKSADFSYSIPEEYQSSALKLQVTSSHNAQFTKLVITTESTSGGEEDTTPAMSADVDALAFKAALNTTTDAQTVTLTVKNLDAVTYICNNAAFGVTDNDDNTYDVTFTAPAEVGTTNGTLTFSADGVDDVVVNLTGVSTNSITDVLNREFTGVTSGSTSYTDWTGTATSGAAYKGQSAGSNDAIQLRTDKNNSGIVTTTSAGKVLSVTVVWQSATSSGRTLQVYGKNSAYTAATDLYSKSTQGTLLGEIVCGTSTTLIIEGDYEYIGLRSESGAMYISEIQIEWGAATPDPEEVAVPTFDPVSGTVVKMGTVVTITSAEGTTLWYTVNGGTDNETDTNTATITINEETIIEAAAVKDENKSDVVTATYTIAQLPAPTFDPAPGEVEAGTEVTISAATGATIYYAIGEADFEEYTTAIVVNEAVTIKAYATQVGYIDSEIVTSAYTIKADAPDAGGEGTGVYELITDVNDLIVGRNIILVGVNNESYYAMDVQNNNNRAGVSVDVNGDNTITPAATTAIIELGQEGANYTFSTPDGYLYAASNSSNQLKSQASNDANGQWSISVTSSGVASIIAQGDKSRNVMQFNYNGGSPLFACYASASQKPVYIYQEIVNSTDPAIAVDPEELAFGEKQVGTVSELAFTATAKNFEPTNTTYTISGDAVFALSGDNSKVVFTAPIQTAAAEYNATVTVTMDELSVNIPVTAALLAPVMTADAECNLGSRQIETSNTAAATVAYSLTNIGELTPEVTCSLANGTVFTAAVVEGGVEIGYAAGAEIALYEDVLTISAKLSDDVTLTTTTAIKMTTFDSNPALIANPATVELSVVATYSVGGSVTLTANNITDDAETDDVDESVITYALSGANADAFEVEYLDYEDGLMYYGVTFNAPATAGIYTATLTFSSEYYGVESSVTLQGTSVLAGMVQVAYEPFNFEGKPAGYNNAVQILPSETGTFPYVYDWVIMDTPIYAGSSFLKFGSSSDYDVQMKSTNILANIPAGATFIVYLDIANWSSPVDSNPESSGVTITYNGVSQSVNPVDGEVGSGGTYSEEHFTTPIQFTFTKAEGVEDLIISSAGGRKILDNLTIYSQASDDQVMVIATYPKVGATAVARETTNAMSISFNKSVESVDMNKITINGNWVVAEGDEREVLLNRIENNTVFFMVNSPEMEYGKDANGQVIRASNCLTDMATEYTVNVAEGAVTFVEATPAPRKGMARAAAVSPAYSWSFTTQSMATDIDNISVAGALAYNGREVVAADSAAMIEVYNMSGVLVAAERGRADLNALAGGVYVVRCGNDVMKVVR